MIPTKVKARLVAQDVVPKKPGIMTCGGRFDQLRVPGTLYRSKKRFNMQMRQPLGGSISSFGDWESLPGRSHTLFGETVGGGRVFDINSQYRGESTRVATSQR